MRFLPAVGLCLLLALNAACGKKGVPQPPHIRVAAPTRDLEVFQRSDVAVLEWSYPSSTTAGGPLPDIESIELWRALLPLGQEPTGTSVRDKQVKHQLLETQGDIVTNLDLDAIDLATRGPKLHTEDDLTNLHTQVPNLEHQVIWYSVRTICCDGRSSAYSNIARLVLESPPEPPTEFSAEGSRDGIHLHWSEDLEHAVRIERSTDELAWTVVTPDPVQDFQWTDSSADQGRVWNYRLRSVRTGSTGADIVGEPGQTITVDHPDVYPPPTPQDLVCLPEGSLVRLRWTSTAEGVVFRIERRRGEGPFQIVDGGVDGLEYADAEPPLGDLTYRVQAVDPAGNVSETVTCETFIGTVP